MAQKKTAATSRTDGRAHKATQQKKKSLLLRECVAILLILLAVFTFIGFFPNQGKFINLFCSLVKGLVGGGFYMVPFALALSAIILLTNHDCPVAIKLACTFLLPVLFGGIYQLIVVKEPYSVTKLLCKLLWTDGQKLGSGGVLAGGICAVFVDLFTKVGAVVFYILLILVAFLVLANKSITELVLGIKNRKQHEYQPEIVSDAQFDGNNSDPSFTKMKKLSQTKLSSRKKVSIDIPLDDEPVSSQTERKKASSGRKQQIFSPADFGLTASESEIKLEEPAVVVPQPIVEEFVKPAEQIPEKKAEPEIIVSEPVKAVPISENVPKKKKDPIPEITVPDSTAQETTDYVFPPMELLTAGNNDIRPDGREETRLNKDRLESALNSFGIHAVISNIVRGPSVTRYEMELEAGIRLNRLTNLSDDIALALGVSGVRIAAIPNKLSTVGIEIPNKLISTVYLRDIIASSNFKNSSSKLTFAIGQNISGDAIVGNIAKLPHLLVAGTTGSGKSVCLNSLILSIMYKATPDEVKFIMVDPKMVEFKIYNGIPHLLIPVVTEAKKAAGALQWAVTEMMKRYRLFSESGARDIQSYNDIAEKEEELSKLPRIVVVIDELADLMMIAAKEVEESICRVAQMGRAAGVHLVIATQSPRADVITGLMKANIPSRIALKVSSSLESRIILDAGGNADKLVGNGDMLFAPIGTSKPTRIQGTWVSDEERESIVEFVKKSGSAEYDESVIAHINEAASQKDKGGNMASKEEAEDDYDELLPQAVDVILETGQASVSMLQRRLKLGYARAARIVDQMEEKGIVGPFEGSKPRQILITKEQWMEMQFVNGTAPVVQDDFDEFESETDFERFDEEI